ncbi:phosphoesterase family-domain-containing protein [Mariannaea sp. PMI_226]|nr:phosphoesterase family-domain-containing protein [Mariannaea sp. PMI_226]
MLFQAATVLAAAGLAAASSPYYPPPPPNHDSVGSVWETRYTATATQDVAKAAATAKTSSPTSHVKGKVFDRIAIVYFENTDYSKAAGDPNFRQLAKKGITLSNFYGVTHPSEPNYLAAVAGDYFGMQNDNFNRLDENVTTVIDLLESRGISWGMYQEDMPYSGYEGFSWVNQKTGANDYVRKHNPGVLADIITRDERRLSQIKNLSMIDTKRSQFHKDFKANKLPQWMFITPNMTSDGHDTSVTVAGKWCHDFLKPLLTDTRFMKNTLVLITFDENETYALQNRVFSIVLGDVVPKHLEGSTDSSFYNHYSEIATVEANWNLPTLGRWDVGANVLHLVGQKTGDKIREFKHKSTFNQHFWNVSYAGFFNTNGGNKEYPKPNVNLRTHTGRSVYGPIKAKWEHSKNPTYYEDTVELPDGLNPPKAYKPVA